MNTVLDTSENCCLSNAATYVCYVVNLNDLDNANIPGWL